MKERLSVRERDRREYGSSLLNGYGKDENVSYISHGGAGCYHLQWLSSEGMFARDVIWW